MDVDNEDLSQEFFLKPNPHGAIGQQFVIEYQTAIDDLMKTSRYPIVDENAFTSLTFFVDQVNPQMYYFQ